MNQLSQSLTGHTTLKQCLNAANFVCFNDSSIFQKVDAETYASWGVDFVKSDDCFLYPSLNVVDDYQRFLDAIVATGRPMVHSVKSSILAEHAHFLSHMRRVGDDIHDNWDSMLSLIDRLLINLFCVISCNRCNESIIYI